MGKTLLNKYLKQLSKEELIQELKKLYSKFSGKHIMRWNLGKIQPK